MLYKEMNKAELVSQYEKLKKEYNDIKDLNLSLNMSRGVPCAE